MKRFNEFMTEAEQEAESSLNEAAYSPTLNDFERRYEKKFVEHQTRMLEEHLKNFFSDAITRMNSAKNEKDLKAVQKEIDKGLQRLNNVCKEVHDATELQIEKLMKGVQQEINEME